MSNPHRRLPLSLLAVVLAGVAFSIYLVVHAHRVNHGIDGFPLDDPWIHLTYARNLNIHHSFSYFPGEKATAGSTSPLYTLLLALGFAFTRDEKVLSYALGIFFHLAFLGAAGMWARKQLGNALWASAFVVILAFDSRIAILSVSGMETSLFLFLIALAFWAWAEKRLMVLGIALGLGVWVRPEMLILAGVFLLAGLLPGEPAPLPGAPKRGSWLIPFGALLLLYVAFNRATGGLLMPNTFAAKHAYYTDPRGYFLTHGVRDSFLTHGFLLLTPLAIGAMVAELARLLRREPDRYRAEVGWAIALPLAYVLYLTTAHRFDRYLVPALPAVALLGLAALRDGIHWAAIGNRSTAWVLPVRVGGGLMMLAIVTLQAASARSADRQYSEYCLYHYQRHERCGRWLKQNTQPSAVIATHDVGAIAYYSERRIVDVVGLIQRDAIPHLHKPDYSDFLVRFFQREKVTHLAFLENWIEVANQEPLWVADERPEVLRVYAWIPGRTLLVPEEVKALNEQAVRLAMGGDVPVASRLLQRSLQLCPTNSRTWYLLGAVLEHSGDAAGAERAYRKALELFPNDEDALYALGSLLAEEDRKAEALALIRPLVERKPDYPGLKELRGSLAPP